MPKALQRKDVHSDYFQGILQLREPSDALLDFIHQLIEDDDTVWVAKQKKVRGGMDLYVSSNKFLRRLPEKLKQRFFGVSKVSQTLFSKDRQTQKNLYRVTVLFREAPFKRGDRFEVRGKEMQVQGITDRVQLKEVASGKKHLMEFEEVCQAYRHAQG